MRLLFSQIIVVFVIIIIFVIITINIIINSKIIIIITCSPLEHI